MSLDSPDINASHSGSRLLSLDSPTFPSDSPHSRTGDDDLSIDELSLFDPNSILNKPFSLLAKFNPKPPPPPVITTITNDTEDLATPTRASFKPDPAPEKEDEARVREVEEEDEETVKKRAQEKRDEKLKSDIFILKKLNAAFELFHESLEETSSANEVT
jgi:hypothetical protein